MAEATVRVHLVVRILSLKNELTRAEELGHISSTLDYLRYKSELLYEHAVRLSPTDSSNVAYNEVLFKLRQVAIARARGATLKVGGGGGGLTSDSKWGAENTFFSVTL